MFQLSLLCPSFLRFLPPLFFFFCRPPLCGCGNQMFNAASAATLKSTAAGPLMWWLKLTFRGVVIVRVCSFSNDHLPLSRFVDCLAPTPCVEGSSRGRSKNSFTVLLSFVVSLFVLSLLPSAVAFSSLHSLFATSVGSPLFFVVVLICWFALCTSSH